MCHNELHVFLCVDKSIEHDLLVSNKTKRYQTTSNSQSVTYQSTYQSISLYKKLKRYLKATFYSLINNKIEITLPFYAKLMNDICIELF